MDKLCFSFRRRDKRELLIGMGVTMSMPTPGNGYFREELQEKHG